MTGPLNPYATSLDGLDLPDPVGAFFDFCRAREQVRVRRDRGDAPPWTTDLILQKGRFLNVFREDDRGSRAIARFVEPVRHDLELLVQALFFARWCNEAATLDRISVHLLQDPQALRQALERDVAQPWFNATAYPVGAVRHAGRTVERMEAATELFHRMRTDLTDTLLEAKGSVVRATAAVNAEFEMHNPFPIFMAVVDVASHRPDVIDPAAPVPTGIGAAPFLDRLQQHLGTVDHQQTCRRMIDLQPERWPEARRPLQPIDVEYLSCECRKYYSYVNGTKDFTGKNRFTPGVGATLTFDVPPSSIPDTVVHTQVVALAGGPCSGKSTLLRALEASGRPVQYETAELLLRQGIEDGATAWELRADAGTWQLGVLQRDFELFDGHDPDVRLFTDTSFVEDLVFARRAGVQLGSGVQEWLERRRLHRVYLLDAPPDYEQTSVRMETAEDAAAIADGVAEAYRMLGYEPRRVPWGPVEARLAFVLKDLPGPL